MMLGNTVNLSNTYDLNYQLAEQYHANGCTVMDRTYTPDNVRAISPPLPITWTLPAAKASDMTTCTG